MPGRKPKRTRLDVSLVPLSGAGSLCPAFGTHYRRPFPAWFPSPSFPFPGWYPHHLLPYETGEIMETPRGPIPWVSLYGQLVSALKGKDEAVIRQLIEAEARRVLEPAPAALEVWRSFCALSPEEQHRFEWLWQHGYSIASGLAKEQARAVDQIEKAAHQKGRKTGRPTARDRTLALGKLVYDYQIDNPSRWSWWGAAVRFLKDNDRKHSKSRKAKERRVQHARDQYCEHHNLFKPVDPAARLRVVQRQAASDASHD